MAKNTCCFVCLTLRPSYSPWTRARGFADGLGLGGRMVAARGKIDIASQDKKVCGLSLIACVHGFASCTFGLRPLGGRRVWGGGPFPSVPSPVWDMCNDDLLSWLSSLCATSLRVVGRSEAILLREREGRFPKRANQTPIPSPNDGPGGWALRC